MARFPSLVNGAGLKNQCNMLRRFKSGSCYCQVGIKRMSLWRNGQRVGLLIQRLRVRPPPETPGCVMQR
ncbi:hypothetical protein FR483_n353R [Paramecium bursaria Chlorella virus FR483]|uniref:Uncharacterized protein n353R n=1 Tax=Paramecium bursaria Chlorella virus FR483 TaxID=399781 RepID=A7J757_PBCVF|nr:hypothetical protein FR483_n353R [Paramecium bursaria Chlorella virus FR483]ABT15638.1 hypothetical protein FR483_n353R [Paramecium bursaria Chlorella virus FR483]